MPEIFDLFRKALDADQNRLAILHQDYNHLGEALARSGHSIEDITTQVQQLAIVLPSWGTSIGGTRFGRFAQNGMPTTVYERVEDCAVVNHLTGLCPRVSLHIPWDHVDDCAALKAFADDHAIGFDAINSNTFQDQESQAYSYRFGSLSHTDPSVRAQAIAHNIDCIDIGQKLGSKALTIWVADGSNFAGQSHFDRALDRYLESAATIYGALPDDWLMFLEHKFFEPAFYSTVIADWGTSFICAQQLGPKAQCLVDLGHHAPNVNIEMIVSRLARLNKLGGLHFNDSKYGDDDLDVGSINPFQLFLICNELIEAKLEKASAFNPAYMLDQSHNITDPIESLMSSATQVAGAYARALLIDRKALHFYQENNDPLRAHATLKMAYETDIRPILAMARHRSGGAIDAIDVFRDSRYRFEMSQSRTSSKPISGTII